MTYESVDRDDCACRQSRACQERAPAAGARVSGQVDATEVQVAADVGGRMLEMPIAEGDRVKQGDVIARLDTRDVDLALQRAQAERAQADAQLRLLQAGARAEDIRQAEAQVSAARPTWPPPRPTSRAAETDLAEVRAAPRRATPDRRNSATMPRRGGMWRAIGWIRHGRARRRPGKR